MLTTAAAIGSGLRRSGPDTRSLVSADPFASRSGQHRLFREFAENTIYDDQRIWQPYREQHRLPRALNAIYNPASRVIDWYAGRLYEGAWTEDGRPLPDGTPHALSFPEDILDERPQLVAAAMAFLDWGEWKANRNVYVREGTTVGSAFIEILDDVEHDNPRSRSVAPVIRPVEEIKDIDVSAAGHVKGYVLEYVGWDRDQNENFVYRKEVTRDQIVDFRDRRPWHDGPNPYGFVPGVWVRHKHVGGLFGRPPIATVIPKLDALNALATQVFRYIHRLQNQPVVFWSDAEPVPVGQSVDSDVGNTEVYPWLWGTDSATTKGRVENLMQTVPIEGAGERIDKLLQEIEADMPETTIDRELRSMSTVTGPGAERMLGDVRGRYSEAQSNYDAGTVKAIQMGVSIGGWRLSRGDWGPRSQLTRAQAKFIGFDLDSYARGDLDLTLLPRPLVPETEQERLVALDLRKTVGGWSDSWAKRQMGASEAEIAANDQEVKDQIERATTGSYASY